VRFTAASIVEPLYITFLYIVYTVFRVPGPSPLGQKPVYSRSVRYIANCPDVIFGSVVISTVRWYCNKIMPHTGDTFPTELGRSDAIPLPETPKTDLELAYGEPGVANGAGNEIPVETPNGVPVSSYECDDPLPAAATDEAPGFDLDTDAVPASVQPIAYRDEQLAAKRANTLQPRAQEPSVAKAAGSLALPDGEHHQQAPARDPDDTTDETEAAAPRARSDDEPNEPAEPAGKTSGDEPPETPEPPRTAGGAGQGGDRGDAGPQASGEDGEDPEEIDKRIERALSSDTNRSDEDPKLISPRRTLFSELSPEDDELTQDEVVDLAHQFYFGADEIEPLEDEHANADALVTLGRTIRGVIYEHQQYVFPDGDVVRELAVHDNSVRLPRSPDSHSDLLIDVQDLTMMTPPMLPIVDFYTDEDVRVEVGVNALLHVHIIPSRTSEGRLLDIDEMPENGFGCWVLGDSGEQPKLISVNEDDPSRSYHFTSRRRSDTMKGEGHGGHARALTQLLLLARKYDWIYNNSQ
jgi:hypothetical protein